MWNKRISTGLLNRWLGIVLERHPPPLVKGKRIKIRYITQSKSRPPTFIIFSSRADNLPLIYVRYLVNDLRNYFKLPGIPIRVNLRKGNNPYVD